MVNLLFTGESYERDGTNVTQLLHDMIFSAALRVQLHRIIKRYTEVLAYCNKLTHSLAFRHERETRQ